MAIDFTQANNALVTKAALTHAIGIIDGTYLKKTEKPGFKISKLATPEDGFASSYKLVTDADADIAGSAVINIAKDMMLQDVSLNTCATANSPLEGYAVGDKYFDFMVYTQATAGEGVKHLYVKVNELVDAYTNGNAAISIDGSTNKVSLVIDTTNANGLEVGTQGLKLNLASTTSAGAMSSADKTKLDGIYAGATKVEASSTPGNIKVNDVETTIMSEASTSAAGMMSAADKNALDKAVSSDDLSVVTIAQVNTMFTDLGVTLPDGTATE